MTRMSAAQRLSASGFAILLLIALMMGANHVAARLAFNHGVDVVTAVAFRSGVTALVVVLILWRQRVAWRITARHKRFLPLIGGLIAVQSVCLYSSVARLPVALALLVFNTYPISAALWARLFYGHKPERFVVMVMPVMLLGLALALDVMGATSGLGAAAQWPRPPLAWPWCSPNTKQAIWTAVFAPSPPWARWRCGQHWPLRWVAVDTCPATAWVGWAWRC
jgi:drug/metabolite transporter (DMT)-like permease